MIKFNNVNFSYKKNEKKEARTLADIKNEYSK